jgi:hypothetical protein
LRTCRSRAAWAWSSSTVTLRRLPVTCGVVGRLGDAYDESLYDQIDKRLTGGEGEVGPGEVGAGRCR